VKKIATGEELLVDYDLNQINGSIIIMGVNMFFHYIKPIINVFICMYLTYILISHDS
jgi:hypothetical protein